MLQPLELSQWSSSGLAPVCWYLCCSAQTPVLVVDTSIPATASWGDFKRLRGNNHVPWPGTTLLIAVFWMAKMNIAWTYQSLLAHWWESCRKFLPQDWLDHSWRSWCWQNSVLTEMQEWCVFTVQETGQMGHLGYRRHIMEHSPRTGSAEYCSLAGTAYLQIALKLSFHPPPWKLLCVYYIFTAARPEFSRTWQLPLACIRQQKKWFFALWLKTLVFSKVHPKSICPWFSVKKQIPRMQHKNGKCWNLIRRLELHLKFS